MISIRRLKAGGALLLDALSTFTAAEVTTYNEFVALTIIINALTLKRADLKKRLITAPEVISVAQTLEQTYLLPSRLLSPHTRYYVREMRMDHCFAVPAIRTRQTPRLPIPNNPQCLAHTASTRQQVLARPRRMWTTNESKAKEEEEEIRGWKKEIDEWTREGEKLRAGRSFQEGASPRARTRALPMAIHDAPQHTTRSYTLLPANSPRRH
ncbi:hypothetical protein EDB19DRAFT_1945217 [Suillus lakei]|nr:hypothetical protein EDB19DRAFT_1945217 [Suillus lakei]